MKFEPTKESLDRHKVPEWYDNAKLGMFIHWSLFSVPAYAPATKENLAEMMENKGLAYAMKHNPYAEWYLNTLRIDDSPTQAFHKEQYGEDFSYFGFQKEFEEKSSALDMNDWAEFFQECGAKYVVMVTKHHDGYCLWPSTNKNPNVKEYQAQRDFVGELAEAVRARGMRFGIYYSGLLDWTFKEFPINSDEDFLRHRVTSTQYAEYSVKHIRELIERYRPELLFNDIGFPGGVDLNKIFADYYNEVPDGVVNNRWRQIEIPARQDIETEIKRILEEAGAHSMNENMLEFGVHCDYVTPEYINVDEIQKKKFEATRGVGLSFGYNQVETKDKTLSTAELIGLLVELVSKNGNLLINVGPMANGKIPEIQKNPLLEMGEWLKKNGEAIYNTRPWQRPSAKTSDGKEIRFTCNGSTLYVIVLDKLIESELTIEDLQVDESTEISILGEGEVDWVQTGNDLRIKLPAITKQQPIYSLKIEPK